MTCPYYGGAFKRSLAMANSHSFIRMSSSFTPNNSAASSRIVLLPSIPELLNPGFLDILLPPRVPHDGTRKAPVSVVSNPMMEALKSVSHQTLTKNLAPAYCATDSAVLDVFISLNRYTTWNEMESYLEAAWKEDSNLTLRIIWNLRSIHDGKGEKEAFYQLVNFDCFSFNLLTTILAPLGGFTRTIRVPPFPICLSL